MKKTTCLLFLTCAFYCCSKEAAEFTSYDTFSVVDESYNDPLLNTLNYRFESSLINSTSYTLVGDVILSQIKFYGNNEYLGFMQPEFYPQQDYIIGHKSFEYLLSGQTLHVTSSHCGYSPAGVDKLGFDFEFFEAVNHLRYFTADLEIVIFSSKTEILKSFYDVTYPNKHFEVDLKIGWGADGDIILDPIDITQITFKTVFKE